MLLLMRQEGCRLVKEFLSLLANVLVSRWARTKEKSEGGSSATWNYTRQDKKTLHQVPVAASQTCGGILRRTCTITMDDWTSPTHRSILGLQVKVQEKSLQLERLLNYITEKLSPQGNMSLISIWSMGKSIFISILSSITAKHVRVAQQQIKLQPKVYTIHLKKNCLQ